MIKLSDYAFSLLREGELRLYRGVGGEAGSILIVVPADEEPSTQSVARLQNEYALRADLDTRWAARPVGLARHDERIALVLDDPAGAPLRDYCHAPLGLADFLPWAIALAGATHQAHLHGLIHHDICPENVLIDVHTHAVRLTGFGLASRHGDHHAPGDVASLRPDAASLAGNLAYMAPERTGRLNQTADARSDLYALGCTLYELLVGAPPLSANDPLAWVHSHVARQPTPLSERCHDLPATLANIVMKLLAKSPDDRYQSAAGLLDDLRRCETQWRETGQIQPFALDMRSVAHRLKVSERLYGRDAETRTLLAAFERVEHCAASEWIRIGGPSGSGKSALVRELRNRLPAGRHRFASGKCEQVKRAIPYGAFAQALQGLVRPILGLDDAAFEQWGVRLSRALGPNARLLTALVPDLNLVLGATPPVADLPPQEEKARFLRVAARLISAFATPDEPLVLFIDDLQWMDAGTQSVLEYLASSASTPHLLLIGAYRDNEIPPNHPLFDDTRAELSASIHDIRLGPLAATDIARLVSDALDCSYEHALPLAGLVQDTTRGDPFFSIQLIASLAEEGLIGAGSDAQAWSRDLDRIRARGYSDNVVDLMLRKLELLPSSTRSTLDVLACLGSGASMRVLAQASGLAPEALQATLDDACAANLVYRLDNAYLFWHDRIQEAAYASIPVEHRASAHLEIGRRLARLANQPGAGNTLFETVGQINRGALRGLSPTERHAFAALNLEAGRQAKAATAYLSALTYLEAGARLLDGADSDDTAHAIELHRAECEFLTGSPAVAERRVDALSRRMLALPLRAQLTRLRIALYTTRDRIDMALEAGHAYFREVGIDIPSAPTSAEVDREFERMIELMGGRPIEALAELPLMRHPVWRATLDVFADLIPPALFTNEHLHALIRLRMTNLSLEHGHCDASCYAYACLTHIFGSRLGDYESGLKFAELARYLMNERGLTRFRARVELSYGALVLPWKRPAKSGQAFMRYALQNAIEGGDRVFELLCRRNLVSNLIFAGTSIEEMQREAETGLGFAQDARFGVVIDAHLAQIVLCRRLRGQSLDTAALLAAGYDTQSVQRFERGEPSSHALAAFAHYTYTLGAAIVFDDIQGALAAIEAAIPLQWSSRSFLEYAEFHFYAALARAAATQYSEFGPVESHLSALDEHYTRMLTWAQHCPENFAGRLALIEAEIARIDDRIVDAEHHYERAVRHAQEQGLTQIEALCAEFAARFYAQRGLATISRAYLRNARYAYLVWGAHAKVRALEALEPGLRDAAKEPAQDDAPASSNVPAAPRELDMAVVIRASHALSGEILLSRVIEMLMTIALEHAGAERGVLLRRHGDRIEVEAHASTSADGVSVVVCRQDVEPRRLPVALLQTVLRTRERVIIDDAQRMHGFPGDLYFREPVARSVMCMPLIKQGELTGLLYLENSLAAGTFTPARVALLEMLASQAAISIENARLYTALSEENSERKNAEEALALAQGELAHVTRVVTLGGLAASIAHEVNQPLTSIVTHGQAGLRWLERDVPDTAEVANSLRRMVSEARRAADVIAGIRALSKKTPSQKTRFSLNELIEETLALVRREISSNHIFVLRQFDGDLPFVIADRVQLQQVLINLLVNAVQALSAVDDRARELRIVTYVPEDEHVHVGVEDNGPGIAPEHQAMLFNAFFTTKSNGMGMGLSICRSIIESHGGRLWAETSASGGANMQFTLPVDTRHDDTPFRT